MIQSPNNAARPADADPLIDEVRAIRRAICDEFGNDVDRLVDHLREVEAEYQNGTGRFAGLLNLTSAEVAAGWGDDVNQLADPLLDEVRELRRQSSG